MELVQPIGVARRTLSNKGTLFLRSRRLPWQASAVLPSPPTIHPVTPPTCSGVANISMRATSLREEISDLRAYIGGLPEEIRNGPYGEIYQERLECLLREVAEIELAEVAQCNVTSNGCATTERP